MTRALIAATDDATVDIFSAVLAARGYAVEVVPEASAAWHAYTERYPAVLVLDLDLRGADGGAAALAFCRRVRQAERDAEHAADAAATPPAITYVLAVALRDRPGDLLEALDAGADDYITQPPSTRNVAARLAIAERRMAQDGARRQAERALLRARYLAGIGETSIALQHEINNPLAALLGHAALIEHGMAEPGEERELLDVIVEQAHRIAGVMKRLAAVRDPTSVEYLGSARMLDLSRDLMRTTGEHPALPPAASDRNG
ncbi:MAG TPA: histidine kinase dimerization/phospho-acceptor domain-containing protein [Gemmatirosa sp.]